MSDRLDRLVSAALRAGSAISAIYERGARAETKRDGSPVTEADRTAETILLEALARDFPGIPTVAEEEAAAGRIPAVQDRFFLVDPLDGTREFLGRNGEFTVNIALIENGEVVFGVVSMPTSGRSYFGGRGLGAWRAEAHGEAVPIQVRSAPPAGTGFTVVASRRHSSPEQEALLAGLSAAVGELQLANIGSSLKFCLMAEGSADCYPRLAPTSQWDTAAAQGVLEGAGGEVIDVSGQPLRYPPRESLLNPFFLALPGAAPWRQALLDLI